MKETDFSTLATKLRFWSIFPDRRSKIGYFSVKASSISSRGSAIHVFLVSPSSLSLLLATTRTNEKKITQLTCGAASLSWTRAKLLGVENLPIFLKIGLLLLLLLFFSPFAAKQVFPLAASSFLEGDLSKPKEEVVRFSKKRSRF